MSEEDKEPKDPIEPSSKWVIIVGIGMIAAWLVNLFWGIWAMDNDRTKGGEWGDIFGAVNALFSGAAFIMIFRGYEMQRYEVKLAKRELEESKKQTKAQKIALDKQNEATERQMFENTFFKLWENTISESKNVSNTMAKTSGAEVFNRLAFDIAYNSNAYLERLGDNPVYSLEEDTGYEDYVSSVHLNFSGYFNSTMSLLLFLNEHYNISEPYAKMVSNRLSDAEIMALCFAPMISHSYKPLGALMKRYNLVKHVRSVPQANLLIETIFEGFYGNL